MDVGSAAAQRFVSQQQLPAPAYASWPQSVILMGLATSPSSEPSFSIALTSSEPSTTCTARTQDTKRKGKLSK